MKLRSAKKTRREKFPDDEGRIGRGTVLDEGLVISSGVTMSPTKKGRKRVIEVCYWFWGRF